VALVAPYKGVLHVEVFLCTSGSSAGAWGGAVTRMSTVRSSGARLCQSTDARRVVAWLREAFCVTPGTVRFLKAESGEGPDVDRGLEP